MNEAHTTHPVSEKKSAKKVGKLGRNPFESAKKTGATKKIPVVAAVLRTKKANSILSAQEKAPHEGDPVEPKNSSTLLLGTVFTAAETQATIYKLQAQVWVLETIERILAA